MRINEVEKIVGISKANIRFYEKEGLLKAARSESNNYREYSEEDIRTLERIKILRLLDISLSEIARLENGEVSLETIVENRRNEIEENEKKLRLIKETLDTILENNLDYNQIDDSILAKSQYYWKDKLQIIMKEDITKVEISRADLNKTIGILVICGLAINVLIAFLAGNWLLSYSSDGSPAVGLGAGVGFLSCLGIGIVSYFIMLSTSNIIILSIDYIVNVLALSPFIASSYHIIKGMTSTGEIINTSYSNIHLALTIALVLLFMVIIYIMSQAKTRFFSCVKNLLIIMLAFIIPVATIMVPAMHMTVIPICIFILLTLYMGFNWYHVVNDANRYSWYYAIRESIRMLNLAGVIFNMWGRQVAPIRVEKR